MRGRLSFPFATGLRCVNLPNVRTFPPSSPRNLAVKPPPTKSKAAGSRWRVFLAVYCESALGLSSWGQNQGVRTWLQVL